MATIIDSLFVEISLETKKFLDGQKKVKTGLKDMGEEAGSSKKEIESFATALEGAFSHLTSSVLKFTGALLGATGITDAFIKINQANASVARSAQVIGLSTDGLSKWEKAAERTGGTAEGIRNTFKGLGDEIARLSVGGTPNSEFFQTLARIGVNFREFTNEKGQLTNREGLLKAIGGGLNKIQDPDQRRAYAGSLHVDEANLRFLTQQTAELQKQLDYQERLGYTTQQQGEHSDKLLQTFQALSQSVTDFARILADDITPYLTGILDIITSITTLFSHRSVVSAVENAVLGAIPGANNIRALKSLYDYYKSTGAGTAAATPTGEVRAPRAGNVKAGANVPLGLYALASSLGGVPGFNQITSGNDDYHKGFGSKHNQGLALDFTIRDASKADAITKAINAKFASMGINANALDEYNHKSAGWTGPHIHVAFANQKALEQYNASKSESGVEFHVQNLTVNANNPKELVDGITQSNSGLKNRMRATPANGGFQ